MNHGFLKVIGMAAWLITALAAVAIGLSLFDYNFFQMDFFANHPELIAPICYVVLAAGLVGLAFFVMSVMGHCGCGTYGCKSCKCK